jgi:hypothetical protein
LLGAGQQTKVRIVIDSGRLSKDDIDRMARDAERYRAEDEAARRKAEAKNVLESFAYSLRNALRDDLVRLLSSCSMFCLCRPRRQKIYACFCIIGHASSGCRNVLRT